MMFLTPGRLTSPSWPTGLSGGLAGVRSHRHGDFVDAIERHDALVRGALELIFDGAGRRRQFDREGNGSAVDSQIFDEAEVNDALLEVGIDDRAKGFEYLTRASGIGHGRESSREWARMRNCGLVLG